MKKETGFDYVYYGPDHDLSSEEKNACVMRKEKYNNIEKPSNDELVYIYKCAKELKIKKFGAVYYRSAINVYKEREHNTDDFYLS